MASTIGPLHGIDAVRNRLTLRDPGGRDVYRKLMSPAGITPEGGPLEGTMHKLVGGHNDVWRAGGLADKLAELREELRGRPFG